MAWSGTDPSHTINLAVSTDGVTFADLVFSSFLAESNFEPSMSPDPFTGALDILYSYAVNSENYLISYTGTGETFTPSAISPTVQAPTITAFGTHMVNAWLGTDPGHTINMCFGCFS